MMEEKKYKFMLELDIPSGFPSFPIRTVSFGFNTLKSLRQASARKGRLYLVLEERKYILNEKGEYEPFVVFGTSIVTLSQLMAAAVRLQMEEEEKHHQDQPQKSKSIPKTWK